MRSTVVFVTAVLLVLLAAWSASARPDGSYGTDCAGCHGSNIPGGGQPTDPPTDPPTNPPADPPADPPTDPPTDPAPDTPAGTAAEQILGVELTTIWDYSFTGGASELHQVFYTVVETDTTVNHVEVFTPGGLTLLITTAPTTEGDNVQTRFRDEGDVFVWEFEARFADSAALEAYGNGDYTINAHTDDGIAEATVSYENALSQGSNDGSGTGNDESDEPSIGDDGDTGGNDGAVIDDDGQDEGHDEVSRPHHRNGRTRHETNGRRHDD